MPEHTRATFIKLKEYNIHITHKHEVRIFLELRVHPGFAKHAGIYPFTIN
jgi:hypothetical protein